MQRRGPSLRQHSCHVEHVHFPVLPEMLQVWAPIYPKSPVFVPATRSACCQCGKLGHFSRLCFYRNVVSHQHVGTDCVSCEYTRHPQQSSSLRNNGPETVGTFAISPKQGDKQKKFKSAAKSEEIQNECLLTDDRRKLCAYFRFRT